MKKSKIIIISVIAVIVILCSILFLFKDKIINGLFSSQYNSNGVSHFLVITIDKNQEKEYIGKLGKYRVYIENLNIKETNFRTKDAENLSIKDAIDKNFVSIEEWKKYAWNIKKDGDAEILQFENYEIVLAYDDCIIRPLAR